MKVLAISVVQLSLAGSKRSGTAVYIASLIEALQEIAKTDVCLLEHQHSGISEQRGKIRKFEISPPPNMLARHFSSWYVGVKSSVWQYSSVALKRFLQNVNLKDYDIAVFLEENAAIYARFLPKQMPKILIRHNLDSESIKIERCSFKAYLRSRMGKYLSRRFDIWTLRDFTKTTIGTEPEKKLLQNLSGPAAVALLPTITRFDLGEISTSPKKAEPGVFRAIFVGGFDYPPNREAIYWFIECQDHLPVELLSALEVVLVGRSPPEIPRGCKIKFQALGFVQDLFSVIARCDFAIIPIVSGSGVKIKSLTLLSSGIPVVTTAEGVSGINVRNEIECLIADDQAEFSRAIVRLFVNPDLRKSLQTGAYEFIRSNFSAQRQNEILLEIIGQAIESNDRY